MARKKRQKRAHIDDYANIARIMPSSKSSSNNVVDVSQTIQAIREAAKYGRGRGSGSLKNLQDELAATRPQAPQASTPEDRWPEYQ